MKNTMRMIGVLLCCGITGLMVQSALGHTFTNGTWFKVSITQPDDESSYCKGVCENVAPGKSFEYKSDNTTVVFNVNCGEGESECTNYQYIGTVTWDKSKKECKFDKGDNSPFPDYDYYCSEDSIWLEHS